MGFEPIQTEEIIREQFVAVSCLLQAIRQELAPLIAQAAQRWSETLLAGGMLAFCGNGGSAAEAQHLAGELVARFRQQRRAYRALALTTDSSVLTAIGNDFSFEEIFARQVEALLKPGDLLVVFSTSGHSPNCVEAVKQARLQGISTMAFTGAPGGALSALVDLCICVPSEDTPRIQEAHLVIGHVLCELVEAELIRHADF